MRNLLILAVVCLTALAGDAAAHRSNARDAKLQVYSSWPGAPTYLGCLNCAATDPTSVWNPGSPYGWANPDGVWSQRALRHADFRHLVCDIPLTASPPVVLDEYWGFYYLLSADGVRRNSICAIEMSRRGCDAMRALCAGKPAPALPPDAWTDIDVMPN